MPPQSNTARRSHAERTHESDQKMLAAAVELITDKGMDNMTLKAVGERAGYSRGLAGYRFGSRQGLFEFIMHSVGERWLERLSSATRDLAGVEAMQAAVQAHCDLCCLNQAPVRAFYILWMSAVSPGSDTREVVNNIDQRRKLDVAQWVFQENKHATPGYADALAAQFSSTIIGIVYHWLANPDDKAAVTAQHSQLIHTMVQLMQPGKSS